MGGFWQWVARVKRQDKDESFLRWEVSVCEGGYVNYWGTSRMRNTPLI